MLLLHTVKSFILLNHHEVNNMFYLELEKENNLFYLELEKESNNLFYLELEGAAKRTEPELLSWLFLIFSFLRSYQIVSYLQQLCHVFIYRLILEKCSSYRFVM